MLSNGLVIWEIGFELSEKEQFLKEVLTCLDYEGKGRTI